MNAIKTIFIVMFIALTLTGCGDPNDANNPGELNNPALGGDGRTYHGPIYSTCYEPEFIAYCQAHNIDMEPLGFTHMAGCQIAKYCASDDCREPNTYCVKYAFQHVGAHPGDPLVEIGICGMEYDPQNVDWPRSPTQAP